MYITIDNIIITTTIIIIMVITASPGGSAGRESARVRPVGCRFYAHAIPASVKKTLLLCEPLPCKPAAETPILPLIWCSDSFLFSHLFFSGGVFLPQTPV